MYHFGLGPTLCIRVNPHDQLNANDADMEKALLSRNVTTNVQMKYSHNKFKFVKDNRFSTDFFVLYI